MERKSLTNGERVFTIVAAPRNDVQLIAVSVAGCLCRQGARRERHAERASYDGAADGSLIRRDFDLFLSTVSDECGRQPRLLRGELLAVARPVFVNENSIPFPE